MDAFLGEHFRGFNAFPSRGDFDENSITRMTFFFISCDELTRFSYSCRGVE